MKTFLQQIDFILIAAWALLFPGKGSMAYFLGFALLAGYYLIRTFLAGRHITTSRFSTALMAAILLLIISALFTPNRQNALLFISDLILVALLVTGFDNGRRNRDYCITGILVLISTISLVTLILRVSGVPAKPGFFFANPIHQGIISGLGAVWLLHFLVRRLSIFRAILLVINLAGVFVSASKAAFIGTVIFGLLSIPLRRRRWLAALAGVVVLTFLIPNPVRDMFHYSLRHDPYAANRIDIWAMSLRVSEAFFPRGTGLGSFGAVAPAFNFPQEDGPARFFKVPRKTHNDYLKLLAESGVFGLIIIFLLGAAVLARIRRRGLRHRSGAVLLYLLFQALLFNLLFELTFLILFLFILDDWMESPRRYYSPSAATRISLAAFLVLLALFSYILPYRGGHYLKTARGETDFLKAFQSARRAVRATPMAPEPHLLLADIYRRYDDEHHSYRALAGARYHLTRARRLNPYSAQASTAEAEILERLISRNLKYPKLEEEIMACLDRARDAAPLNPFIRMHRARIRLEFGHAGAAVKEARNALKLEPRFLEARVFLRRHFPDTVDEDTFRQQVSAILVLRRKTRPRPGSYLYGLFLLPPADRGWLLGTFPHLSVP